MKEREGKIKDVESLAGIENALNGMLDRASVIEINVVATTRVMHSRNDRPADPCEPIDDISMLGTIQRIAIKCDRLDKLLLAINDGAMEITKLVNG